MIRPLSRPCCPRANSNHFARTELGTGEVETEAIGSRKIPKTGISSEHAARVECATGHAQAELVGFNRGWSKDRRHHRATPGWPAFLSL